MSNLSLEDLDSYCIYQWNVKLFTPHYSRTEKLENLSRNVPPVGPLIPPPPHTVDGNLPASVHVYFLHVYRTISDEFSVRHWMVAIFTEKKHAENPIRNHPRNVMKGSKGLELRKYFKVWPWSVEGCAKVVKGNRPVSWFILVFQISPDKVF